VGRTSGYCPSPSSTTVPGLGYFSSAVVSGERQPFPIFETRTFGRLEMPAPPPVMVTTAQFWKNSRSRLFHVLSEIVSISYMNRRGEKGGCVGGIYQAKMTSSPLGASFGILKLKVWSEPLSRLGQEPGQLLMTLKVLPLS